MAPSSIIRLGPNDNNTTAELLRNAITASFETTEFDHSTQYVNDDYNKVRNQRFVIQNKYFNAEIMLKDIDSQHEEFSADEMEDGIILVFDAVRSNPDRRDEIGSGTTADFGGGGITFDSLPSAHQNSLAKNACGDLLRLCVGVSLTELSPSEIRGKDHEKEYSRRILWCLDNGYEYIEADLSEAGKQKGHDCRDKDGYARVIEAIKGTVWSSAVMLKSKSNKMKESLRESRAEIQKSGYDDSVSFPKSEETKQNDYNPPNLSLSTSADSHAEATEQIEKGVTKTESCTTHGRKWQTQDSVAPMFDSKEMTEAMDPDDLNTEKLFVQMENVLKEASQIRNASKNGILSDNERRERAGDAALALVNLMSQFGINDNDGDSDDFGSDDSGIIDDTLDSIWM